MSVRAKWLTALVAFAAMAGACSIPNLDPPECGASRTVVRELFSYHFGNEMKFSTEGLKQRERFLTPELTERLRSTPEGIDPFTTANSDLPKAFRAGACHLIAPDRTEFDILLFWKDDVRSEQRKITVQAAKRGQDWLVDQIKQ